VARPAGRAPAERRRGGGSDRLHSTADERGPAASRNGDSAAARTASLARCASAPAAPRPRAAAAGIAAAPRPSAAVPAQKDTGAHVLQQLTKD